jgi:hypothetical protein
LKIAAPKDDYQSDLSCSWLIDPQTEFDSVSYIKIDFDRFATESDGDFLRIYDGPDTDSPLLGEFSGTDIPSTITSENNKVLVTFTTNQSVTDNGWLITYKAYKPSWCSGMLTFTEPSGTFDDGSSNFYYNNNSACMFRITPENPTTTTLYFNYLDTEENYDVVKVFDYYTQELLAEVSGTDIPDPIVSQSGQFFVTFNSNSSIRGNGWEIFYTSEYVGIADDNDFENLRIYPNPAKDQLTIAYTNVPSEHATVTINSMTGAEVYSESLQNFKGSYNKTIDVSNLKKGVYMLSIRNETGIVVKKLVIE